MRARYWYQIWLGGSEWSPWKVGWTDDGGKAFVPPYSRVFVEIL